MKVSKFVSSSGELLSNLRMRVEAGSTLLAPGPGKTYRYPSGLASWAKFVENKKQQNSISHVPYFITIS